MNSGGADDAEVIIREYQGDGNNAARARTGSTMMRSASAIAGSFSNGVNGRGSSRLGARPPERKVCEETQDAIWEEAASSDQLVIRAAESSRVGGGSHLSLEKVPEVNLLRADDEYSDDSMSQPMLQQPRQHRSLDFDIHITEPNNIVMLRDRVYSKPLSDTGPGVESDFSFRPRSNAKGAGSAQGSTGTVDSMSSFSPAQQQPPQPQPQKSSRFMTSPPAPATSAMAATTASPDRSRQQRSSPPGPDMELAAGRTGAALSPTQGSSPQRGNGGIAPASPASKGGAAAAGGAGAGGKGAQDQSEAGTTKTSLKEAAGAAKPLLVAAAGKPPLPAASGQTVLLTSTLVRRDLKPTRTKSRLVETQASAPSSSPKKAGAAGRPPLSPAGGKTGQYSGPQPGAASGRANTLGGSRRVVMVDGDQQQQEQEEDPFKDVDDAERSFKQGNLKPITVAQWAAFVVLAGCLVCTLTVQPLEEREVWGLHLWRWFLLALVVLCGRLVSGWLIRLVVILFERNFLLRKKVLYFVYGLRKGVQNCLWVGLALLAWKLMFDPRVERSARSHKALKLVTKLLECFLIAAAFWLVKILLVKSLASSFHVSTFFDRIQDSLFNQHVLEALSGPPLLDLSFEASIAAHLGQHHSRHQLNLQIDPANDQQNNNNALNAAAGSSPRKGASPSPSPRQQLQPPRPSASTPTAIALSLPRSGKKEAEQQQAPISIQELQQLDPQNVSAGLMKRLINLVKHPGIGTLVTTIDENVYSDEYQEEIEIDSEMAAKAAAKRIFKNVARENSWYIEKDDLLRFVTVEEIPKVLACFEGAKDTGRISKKALKNWVVKVYQERRALAHSLNDTKTAVDDLHRIASVVVSIVIIIVWLLVLGIASTHVLLFIMSQLLLVAFMFGNTVKVVFEALIFLFVMHPYDVGDRCVVDGVQLVVEEMNILTTVFLRPDNEKVYYPNSVLATKPISNLYRSPEMKDMLDFSFHISTPTEKITALKEKIAGYIIRKSEHWRLKFSVVVKELEDLNRMKVTVVVQHTINFQNAVDRLSRRSDLLLELRKYFQELGIDYRLLPQSVDLTYLNSPPPPTTNIQPIILPSLDTTESKRFL